MSKWSKMRKIGNFWRANGHNTTFQWFLLWFISISEVCLCVRWIFIEIAHTLTSNDIILTSTLRRKWSKMRKIVNFDCVNGHNTTFQWFLWWFISISEVCLCVRWIFIEIAHTLTSNDIILTSTLRRKWSKMRKIVNFDCVNGHNTTFQWFLWWFTSINAVC